MFGTLRILRILNKHARWNPAHIHRIIGVGVENIAFLARNRNPPRIVILHRASRRGFDLLLDRWGRNIRFIATKGFLTSDFTRLLLGAYKRRVLRVGCQARLLSRR